MIAISASQVSEASLQIDRKTTYAHRNNYCCSSDWIGREFNSRCMNLNTNTPNEAVAWASLQLDADCPLFDRSDSENSNCSNADHGRHHDIAARGNQVSITDQCTSIGREEGGNTPILPNF
jgi:hypothetical protein